MTRREARTQRQLSDLNTLQQVTQQQQQQQYQMLLQQLQASHQQQQHQMQMQMQMQMQVMVATFPNQPGGSGLNMQQQQPNLANILLHQQQLNLHNMMQPQQPNLLNLMQLQQQPNLTNIMQLQLPNLLNLMQQQQQPNVPNMMQPQQPNLLNLMQQQPLNLPIMQQQQLNVPHLQPQQLIMQPSLDLPNMPGQFYLPNMQQVSMQQHLCMQHPNTPVYQPGAVGLVPSLFSPSWPSMAGSEVGCLGVPSVFEGVGSQTHGAAFRVPGLACKATPSGALPNQMAGRPEFSLAQHRTKVDQRCYALKHGSIASIKSALKSGSFFEVGDPL